MSRTAGMARRSPRLLASVLCAAQLLAAFAAAQSATETEEWLALFNGADLEGWTVKIRGFPAGENYADTFRVEDGLLTVSYDGYPVFEDRFGHIFHDVPYSHYRLRVEYRFTGSQAPGGPPWAARNSGAMLHAQSPDSMLIDQDFPISVEFQFLGGLGDGEPRPTGNVCTPGTDIAYRGALAEAHCIDSTSATYDGDQWVFAEALVLGSERVAHYIDGRQVIAYGELTIGGGVVSGHDPAMKTDGEPLGSGHIALQSESHPVQFRRVELLNLAGCMDLQAANYKRYYVVHEAGSCVYGAGSE